MEYKVVRASDEYELEREVERLISEGWTPQGGLAIGMMYRGPMLTDRTVYAQAMIREGR